MLARGVSVSLDTLLRGMLTPTEYRLRKKEQELLNKNDMIKEDQDEADIAEEQETKILENSPELIEIS